MKNESSFMAASNSSNLQSNHHHASNNTITSSTTANQTSTIMTQNNTTMNFEHSAASSTIMNVKCSVCERDLDGSFRIMKHAICGLRYCAHHMQEVLNSPHHSTCPRCDKKI